MAALRRRHLFCIALFFGIGATAADLFGLPPLGMLAAMAVLGLSSLLVALAFRKRRLCGTVALLLLYLAFSCSGAAYFSARKQARPVFSNSYDAEFSGTIAGQPYLDEDGERFVSRFKNITVNGAQLPYELRLYLRGDEAELRKLGCGQVLSGTGHVFCAEEATNPHQFDFGKALWRDSLSGYLTAKLPDTAVSGARGGISDLLYRARCSLSARIDRLFPESADLVKALVLGDRRDLSSDARQAFRDAGVAHLLAISGLHITLLALAVSFLLRRLVGVRASSLITLAAVLMYGALIGFTPSVARAILMYASLCGAPLLGRPSEASTRLALAFLILMLINPLYLEDAGFVLSFSASAGLIWVSAPLSRLLFLDRIGRGGSLRSRILRYPARSVSATLAAQIATYPAVASFYGSFSVISLLSNLFLVPLCMAGLITALPALAIPPLSVVPDRLLLLLRRAVQWCAGIGWANVSADAPPFWVGLGFFAVALLVSELSLIREKIKPFLLLALPVLASLAVLIAPRSGLILTFLDVGQGDSCVAQAEDYVCVIDLGDDAGAALDYLSGERIRPDALFLSHPHTDHAGGLGEFVREYPGIDLYVPEGWEDAMTDETICAEWDEALSLGSSVTHLAPGDTLALNGRAEMTAYSSGRSTASPANDASMVLLLKFGSLEALFTGDANVAEGPDADVLKVGHHGSSDATDETVVASVSPEIAVISVGKNSYGHPAGEVIDLLRQGGAAVYRTDLCGAVTVTMDDQGNLKVKTYREGH